MSVRLVLNAIAVVAGLLFVAMGMRWLVAPQSIASELGFELGQGFGRSSQVADFAAFFLTAGVCVLLGVFSGRRLWFYPPIMLLLAAAAGRLIAWSIHDASFAGPQIVFELVVGFWLLMAARQAER